MDLKLDRSSPIGLLHQLEEGLRQAIESGELERGDRLPTIQEAAGRLGVNANTVAEAYRRLAREGYLVQRKRAGTRVAESPPVNGERAVARVLSEQLRRTARSAGIDPALIVSAIATPARGGASPVRVAVLAATPLEAAELADRAAAVLGSEHRFVHVTPDSYRSIDYHFTLVSPSVSARLGVPDGPAVPARTAPLPPQFNYGPDFPAGAD